MNKGKAVCYTTFFLTGMATYFMIESKFHITDRIGSKAKKLLRIESPSEHTYNQMKEGSDAVNIVNDRRNSSEIRSETDRERLSKLLDATHYRPDENSTPDNVVKFDTNPEYIVFDEIKADSIEAGKLPDDKIETEKIPDENSEDE